MHVWPCEGLNVARAFGFKSERTRLLSSDLICLEAPEGSAVASTARAGPAPVPGGTAMAGSASGPRGHASHAPDTAEGACVKALLLPHPSGISHFWNSKEKVQNCSDSFRTAIQQLRESTG